MFVLVFLKLNIQGICPLFVCNLRLNFVDLCSHQCNLLDTRVHSVYSLKLNCVDLCPHQCNLLDTRVHTVYSLKLNCVDLCPHQCNLLDTRVHSVYSLKNAKRVPPPDTSWRPSSPSTYPPPPGPSVKVRAIFPPSHRKR